MKALGDMVFFSFSLLNDQSRHRAYGEWHALDHLPENLALPGVRLGVRWVKTPRCAVRHTTPSLRTGDPDLTDVQYLTTYWFGEPVDEAMKQFADLGTRSQFWGRRPELAWTERRMMGYYRPVKGYVSPDALVSADVVPYRVTRGVYVEVTAISGNPADVDVEMSWHDKTYVPALLECRGVAGAWAFVNQDGFDPGTGSAGGTVQRVTIFYLDDDPLTVVDRIEARGTSLQSQDGGYRGPAVGNVLMAGPFETVVPWTWDWFEG